MIFVIEVIDLSGNRGIGIDVVSGGAAVVTMVIRGIRAPAYLTVEGEIANITGRGRLRQMI